MAIGKAKAVGNNQNGMAAGTLANVAKIKAKTKASLAKAKAKEMEAKAWDNGATLAENWACK